MNVPDLLELGSTTNPNNTQCKWAISLTLSVYICVCALLAISSIDRLFAFTLAPAGVIISTQCCASKQRHFLCAHHYQKLNVDLTVDRSKRCGAHPRS